MFQLFTILQRLKKGHSHNCITRFFLTILYRNQRAILGGFSGLFQLVSVTNQLPDRRLNWLVTLTSSKNKTTRERTHELFC